MTTETATKTVRTAFRDRFAEAIEFGIHPQLELPESVITLMREKEASGDTKVSIKEAIAVLRMVKEHNFTGGVTIDRTTSNDEVICRYPCIIARIISGSLGYATPACAAMILKDAAERSENWCEWVYTCWKRDAKRCVDGCTDEHGRRYANDLYNNAMAIVVTHILSCGKNTPTFASWF